MADRVRRAAEHLIGALTSTNTTTEVKHCMHELQLALAASQNAGSLLSGRPPNISTVNEALRTLNTSHENGNFILIAPDGRVWECKDVNKMLGVVISLIDVATIRTNAHAWRF